MYVIIRDPITSANVEVESLTGFVKSAPVEKEFLGTPLSEARGPIADVQKERPAVRHFVLGPKEPASP